ncbi:MAG: glutamate--tRNA ligase [Rhodospirillaceae bacterium]|nr:MAG: glutamate--tRNA ligase [Rhodospirillaceae bacterium]
MTSPSPVITRFAPSPTGYLHIGGARTALFNWLYAKHTGGKFLLRIEDTDRARSTQAAIDAIFAGLTWLGLNWDGEPVFQSARADRHRQAAEQLLAAGKAYHCYSTPEELTALREEQKAKGLPTRYDGRWRNRDPAEAPPGVKPVVRLKAAQDGETVLQDLVQGEVRVANTQLDDMILLRSDGTPTYMLSVVVDDIDMNITHVIRGDDHLTNAFRQLQLFDALGAMAPAFGHIPLIHGPDGAKLSKRHGALGIEAYRDMGFLPEAMRNYLVRLGWAHGDDEIFTDAQAIAWFDVTDINRGPARLDFAKMSSLNAHYIRQTDDARLVSLISPALQSTLGGPLNDLATTRLVRGMPGLKTRAKTLVELAEIAMFYVRPRPIPLDTAARKSLADGGLEAIAAVLPSLETHGDWSAAALEAWARTTAESRGQKLGQVAQPLRAAVVGSTVSPPLFEAMEILGQPECLGRLKDVAGS